MKKILAVLIAVIFVAGACYAAEKRQEQWMKSVASKLGVASAKDKKATRTSVAGVKGAEEKSDEELYWKKLKVSENEAKAMKNALLLAQDGKNKEAIEALEKFLKDYPKSPLARDAKEGIKALKEDKHEAKPEGKTEGK